MTNAIDETFLPDYASFSLHAELLARTADELGKQDEEWGLQLHPFIEAEATVGPPVSDIRDYFGEMAEDEKRSNDIRQELGATDWRGILLGEVYEALAEDDPTLAINELVKVAAVALQAAASIERAGLLGWTGEDDD